MAKEFFGLEKPFLRYEAFLKCRKINQPDFGGQNSQIPKRATCVTLKGAAQNFESKGRHFMFL
jgi:hypothetical protein